MGRVINPDSAGKERNRLAKSTVLALRELMKQTQPDDTSRDLAAYIALALQAISETIETSVTAWEKKGYWLKADRFRMEWDWSARLGEQMEKAVLAEDWGQVALIAAQIGGKLSSVQVAERNRLGQPWVGARQSLREKA